MNKKQAIELMESSVSIDDWNQKRELVKTDKNCGGATLLHSLIDQNGMCVRVLKKNGYKK